MALRFSPCCQPAEAASSMLIFFCLEHPRIPLVPIREFVPVVQVHKRYVFTKVGWTPSLFRGSWVYFLLRIQSRKKSPGAGFFFKFFSVMKWLWSKKRNYARAITTQNCSLIPPPKVPTLLWVCWQQVLAQLIRHDVGVARAFPSALHCLQADCLPPIARGQRRANVFPNDFPSQSFPKALGSFRKLLGSFRKLPEALGSFRRLLGSFRKLLGSFRKLLGSFRKLLGNTDREHILYEGSKIIFS